MLPCLMLLLPRPRYAFSELLIFAAMPPLLSALLMLLLIRHLRDVYDYYAASICRHATMPMLSLPLDYLPMPTSQRADVFSYFDYFPPR